ncbi:hypothetical protein J4050_00625 [Winogradskyella sp. DF17]|uniref:Uncharacterized protein n=1 Tax=Winogradskyella pelagia TaxID=2819984 RepID=A0ABS3SXN5_9FLAO|nr:hypothetical protein [Winogradskyella sp. DF17]MBO3115229.1 hypothetical protein [Winogradskyella sp. DF17]
MRKHICLLLFTAFTFLAEAQEVEVVLNAGSTETDFKTALNNYAVKTITIKSKIKIKTPNLVVPSDKTLKFFNGALLEFDKSNNGSLIFSNATLEAGRHKIFDFSSFNDDSDYNEKISRISGLLNNDMVYPEWFGASAIETLLSDVEDDDAYAIQMAINCSNGEIKLSEGIYRIEHTLRKERADNSTNFHGVKLIGKGMTSTEFRIMKAGINFLEVSGKNGSDGHKPIFGNILKGFGLNGQHKLKSEGANNGFVFYACKNNDIEDVEIRFFKNAGILFDGNPNLNPDLTASFYTEVKYCFIRDNAVGIFSKINNISPIFTLQSSRVINNLRAGVVWNSSYFHSKMSAISFNGKAIERNPEADTTTYNPLGGFYNANQDNHDGFFEPYRSKGIIIETTELDGNYPSAVTLKSSVGAIIQNCAIQQTDQWIKNFKFSEKGLLHIGGDETIHYVSKGRNQSTKEFAINTSVNNNSISFFRTKGESKIEPNASVIRLSKWGVYSKINNNCFFDNSGNYKLLGDEYFYIREINRANETIYNNEGSYLKLSGLECISEYKIHEANDLHLNKSVNGIHKNFVLKFDLNRENNSRTVRVPNLTAENRMKINTGTLVLSSNDPGQVGCILFYRAVNNPKAIVVFKSDRVHVFTAKASISEKTLNSLYKSDKFNVVVMDNGEIKIKNNYNNNLYVTATFLEKLGMFEQ